ncbi:MAG: CHRD domain-containing protein [Acidobacteria bacterium]|nr:CHRD domain-containing protein [Acidobacteriota bacterium]
MKRITVSLRLITMVATAAVFLLLHSVAAQAEIIVFTAQLLASNEVAPVTVNPSENGTSGLATVTLDVTRSGSTITAATARFDVSLNGMASNSVIVLAHIHEGLATANGAVRVDSGLTPSAPVPASFGASFTRSNLTVTPAVAQAIINNPAGFYFNVHTALSPGGVARGQLAVQSGPVGFTVPTLSEWGMILMSLIFVAACTFFMVGRRRAVWAGDNAVMMSDSVTPMDWRLFGKVALAVELIIALTLVLLRAGAVDSFGALTAGLVLAYTLHLLIHRARKP